MVQEVEVTEVDIDGRAFMVRPVGSWVLEPGNVVAKALVVSLDKPLERAVGFFFGNTELSLELWTIIAGISGFNDYGSPVGEAITPVVQQDQRPSPVNGGGCGS